MAEMRILDDTGEGTNATIHVPRPALWGALALIVGSIILAGTASQAGLGRPQPIAGAPVTERALRFTDDADGGVTVWDAATGAPVHRIEPGAENFVRGSMRSMSFERKKSDVPRERPFLLQRWPDGRLTLADPATGTRLELNAFGSTNTAAYAQLLP